ncbi:hypothetical protein GPX89_39490 [Nocardia sp. ET3-3]|uniref:Uncharacterized protein n=1 Tax=Nocardia terrae TaxID=2675851 RepID=A0A7K1V9K8_9NOCA|nr:hypothetical protein [Nocardia terrae]MVU83310.1 hypothetical protein [Nocardia terrae]
MTVLWQAILGGSGAVLAAIIAGSVAVRNARRTPHDVLKSLLDILKDEHIWREDRAILEVAVHREIQRIRALNEARLQGFWAYQRERLLGEISPLTLRLSLPALVLPLCSILMVFVGPVLGVGSYDGRYFYSRGPAEFGLLDNNFGTVSFSRLAMGAAGYLLSVGTLIVVGLMIARQRTTPLWRGWTIFAGLLLTATLVVYVGYRIILHPKTSNTVDCPGLPDPPASGYFACYGPHPASIRASWIDLQFHSWLFISSLVLVILVSATYRWLPELWRGAQNVRNRVVSGFFDPTSPT